MTHCVDVRVHGFHCDLYGHVNHARYLEFLEGARWEAFGGVVDLQEWSSKGWGFVIVHLDIAYRAAAAMGDLLRVETASGEIGRTSAKVQQRIFRVADATPVVEATLTYVVLDLQRQRPIRIDGALRRRLAAVGEKTSDPIPPLEE